MKKNLLLVLLVIAGFRTMAQSDSYGTGKGRLDLHPVYHGSLWLTWNGLTIAIDPYGGAQRYEAMGQPDLVLITDIHGDHMDSSTLVNMDLGKATMILPQAVKDRATAFLPATISMQVLANNATTSFKGIEVTALPMYNLPDTPGVRHPKGRGNGYVLNLGGKRVYISGDTEDIPEMRTLKEIDIAFICMNKPFTMDINQAAGAVLAFKPAIVYPFHFRQPGGYSNVNEFARIVKAGNPAIDVRIRKWY